uniref:LanC-like protein 3 homolog n=1 Tax=Glossina austeni TaxID=7395 RepID=A0A1A9UMM1_GLOAU
MQSLKESWKAPPSESTFSTGEATCARQADIGLGALCYCDLRLSRQVRMQDNALVRHQVIADRLHNICDYFGASYVAVCHTPGLLKFTSKIDHSRLCNTSATKTPNSSLQLLAKEEKEKRYFTNPFPDYVDPRSTPYEFDEKHVKNLIAVYVDEILKVLVAMMRKCAAFMPISRVSHGLKLMQELSDDLMNFKVGITSSKALSRTQYGWDEMLLGRAGYLAGCYWLNDIMPRKEVTDDDLISICQLIIANGRKYAEQFKAPLPLMYQWRGREYLGRAHGLCAILHMLLESPWFRTDPISAPSADLRDVKKSVDYFLALQDDEGNFPVALENLKSDRKTRLVHWCHGAPGAVYLLAKAYLIFKEDKYMQALLSLFEGVAGKACFLVDLLNPKQAQFPFMDVFH